MLQSVLGQSSEQSTDHYSSRSPYKFYSLSLRLAKIESISIKSKKKTEYFNKFVVEEPNGNREYGSKARQTYRKMFRKATCTTTFTTWKKVSKTGRLHHKERFLKV